MFDSVSYKRSRKAYNLECAFEYFVTLMVSDSILAKLLSHLKMSDGMVGIISSLISLSFLFQLFSIPVIRRIKKKKRFAIIFHIIGQASFGLIFLIPFLNITETAGKVLCILLILIAYFGNYFVNSYIYYWGNSFVKPENRGIFSGRKEMISLFSGMFVQIISGVVIDKYIGLGKLNGAFLFSAISIFVFSFLDFITLKIMSSKDEEADSKNFASFKEIKEKTIKNKNYRLLVYYQSLYKIAIFCVSGFVGTYKLSELGMSMTTIQIINIVACFGRFIFSIPLGKYSDKHSFFKGSRLGLIIMAVSSLALMFATPKLSFFVIVYTVLYNISLAGTYANMLNLTYKAVDEKYFSEAFAVKNAVSGIAGFLASIVCGKLLSIIQANNIEIFSSKVYGQQVLAFISLIITIITILFAEKKIKKNFA